MDDVVAQAWDEGAEAYERLRPGYPGAAVEVVASWLGLGAGRTVLDLGAGTGKLSAALATTGADVVAVEPLRAMRRVLERVAPAVDVREGTAEALPIEDASVDGAAVGQAFHWFDERAALGELRRVLRPPRRFVLLWNVEDRDVDWVGSWHRRIDELAASHPRQARAESWLDTLPGIAEHVVNQVANDQSTTRSRLRKRIATTSYVAALDDEERTAFLDRLFTEVVDPAVDGDVVAVPTTCWVHQFELSD